MIAPTPWRIAVTRTDQAIDLLCRQAPWQVRQAPMRHRRDGLIEIDLAQSVGAQISQENAQARNQFLSGAGPAPTGMFQEERADTLRIPCSRIISECTNQFQGTMTVLLDGRFRRTPVLLQPLPEGDRD
jgi:hypothetical protein